MATIVPRRQPYRVLIIALGVALASLLVSVLFLVSRGRSAQRTEHQEALAIAGMAEDSGGRVAAQRGGGPSSPRAGAAARSGAETRRRNSRTSEVPSRVVLQSIRKMTVERARPLQRMGTEAMVHHMMPYLIGMVETVRAVDPAIFTEMRDDLADDLCGGKGNTDADVVLYAKLAILEHQVASERALNCAFAGRTEDYTLWTLLDAWQVLGRPALPALSSIAQRATDPRTTERLRPLDDRAREDVVRMTETPPPLVMTRVGRPE